MINDSSLVIEAHNLVKQYGAAKAVDDLSLEVQRGEILGVLGPNGAGKTTLLEMMVGLRIPTQGTLKVLGYDPQRQRSELVQHIGVQPQEANLFPNLKVLETLRLFASFHHTPFPPEEVLGMIGLQEKAEELVKRLSGGQRQRLLIGVALVADPELLFLDEPTGSLDPQARRQLWDVILAQKRRDRTVMLTTHYMEEAETLCDRVAIVDRGKILALDTPQNLIGTHFPDRTVVFEVKNSIELQNLTALPGVYDATISPKGGMFHVRLMSKESEATLRSLLLNPPMFKPQDIRVEQSTLEDVFLRLTGRNIQAGTAPEKTAAR